MKKFFTLVVSLMVLFTFSMNAQDKAVRGPFVTGTFFENWFVDINGGANIGLDQASKAWFPQEDMEHGYGLAVSADLGKWITPVVGGRVGYVGWATGLNPDKFYFNKTDGTDYNYIHGDILFNISNAISGYRNDRAVDVVPYIHCGTIWTEHKVQAGLAAGCGVMVPIRICNRVSIVPDFRIAAFNSEYMGRGTNISMNGTATVGVRINLGKNGFRKEVVPVPFDDSKYVALLNEKDAKYAALEKEYVDALKRLKAEKDTVCVDTVCVDPMLTQYVVYFAINSSEVSATEYDRLVEALITVDPASKVTVNGYADSATGTPEHNTNLSVERAETIKNALIYAGFMEENITVQGEGGVDIHLAPELDRCVIITFAK